MSRTPDEIFNDALELPPGERQAFVRCECAGDRGLTTRVLRLLETAEEHPHILDPPPTLSRRYHVIRELGRGGMGIVYRARDQELGRDVALKVLRESIGHDPDQLGRLGREARLLATINHPNIATIYDFDREGATISLELIEGETLAARLARGLPSLDEALRICLQIARALEAAHEQGIVHRDLKPANAMIRWDGTVKVLDFGIAKGLVGDVGGGAGQGATSAATGHTRSTFPLGTPGYMSPEQHRGEPIGPAADIWSFGRILAECLGLREPPDGASTATVAGVAKTAAASAGGWSPASPRLEKVALQCTREEARSRPSSMRTVRKALEAEIETLEHGHARRRRRVRGAIATVLAAAVLTAAALVIESIISRGALVAVEVEEGRVVRGMDGSGRTLWVFRTSAPVMKNVAKPGRGGESAVYFPHVVVEDSRGPRGVLLGSTGGGRAGLLWMLSAGSGELEWERTIAWREPRNTSERSQPHAVWQTQIDGPGEPLLAVGIRNGKYYQAGILMIGADGTGSGTYYHPGHLWLGGQYDFDGDGRNSLLLFGDNSSARFLREVVPFETDHHCGAVAILDPDEISGQAYPYSQPLSLGRDWPDLPPAREEAYLLIPPLHPDYRADVLGVDVRSEPGGGWELEVRTKDSRVVYTDGRLLPHRCWLPPGSAADSLQDRGAAAHLPLLHIRAGEASRVEVPVGAGG
ncbi:MAG: protein kinase [Candidatus Eisenbacteria bacterium]|nr:protein kinase [Candidatus Eisenbacteria bacterium]